MTTSINISIPSSFKNLDEYVDSLLTLYKDPIVQKFINEVHIIDFYISEENLLRKVVPKEWIDFLSINNIDSVVDFFTKGLYSDFSIQPPSSLSVFMSNIKKHALPREITYFPNKNTKLHHSISVGMNNKKSHECEMMGSFINTFIINLNTNSKNNINDVNLHKTNINKTNNNEIIDIGSGRGYLCRVLSNKYSLNCLAIESQDDRIGSATWLDKLSSKQLKHIKENNDITISNHISDNNNSNNNKNGKMDSHRGTVNHLVCHIKNEHSLDDFLINSKKSLILVGLHACGDLTDYIIKMFIQYQSAKGLAVVGCCYNLISNREKINEITCPLSTKLKSNKILFPFYAKMIACQVPTTWTKFSRDNFFKRHLFRAIFQKLLYDNNILNNKNGMKKKIVIGSPPSKVFNYFPDYCRWCFKKLNLSLSFTEIELNKYYDECHPNYNELCVLWTMLCCIVSDITETLLILDRAYYIEENGIKNIKVTPIFDINKSSRNVIISAYK